MLKEIAEQPAAVADTLLGHFVDGRIVLDEQRLSDQGTPQVDKVFIVACGPRSTPGCWPVLPSSTGRLPVEVRGVAIPLPTATRCSRPRHAGGLAISQSGETADALSGPGTPRAKRAKVLAICNTNVVQVRRGALRAGPEIGVAAAANVPWHRSPPITSSACMAQTRFQVPDEVQREYEELVAMPDLVARVLEHIGPVTELAGGSRSRRPCSSSAATSATRWRWRVPSSSRNWPTCTPRASPPVSSSTARSR